MKDSGALYSSGHRLMLHPKIRKKKRVIFSVIVTRYFRENRF